MAPVYMWEQNLVYMIIASMTAAKDFISSCIYIVYVAFLKLHIGYISVDRGGGGRWGQLPYYGNNTNVPSRFY